MKVHSIIKKAERPSIEGRPGGISESGINAYFALV